MSLRNGFNPLTAVLAKSGHTRLCRIEAMQLSQSCEHCLNCQLLALGYPISAKKSALFANDYLLNLDKDKNDRF